MKIQLRLHRRKETSGIAAARQAKEQAAEDLAATKRQLAREHHEIVQPVQRLRRRWALENHVTEELVRQLREQGSR